MDLRAAGVDPALASVFPVSAGVGRDGRLALAGVDCRALAERFGTPLYVFDTATLRAQARAFRDEFAARYPAVRVAYAAKATIGRWLARLLDAEGLGFDVVSGGELAAVLAGGVSPKKVHFHGNNKLPAELEEALDAGVDCVVVDNFYELELLDGLARRRGARQDVLLRVAPGIDPHTHAHTTTGTLDSKFGFPIATSAAEEAVRRAMVAPGLRLRGIHAHLGSPIFETEPYRLAIEVMLDFAARMQERYRMPLEEFSPGGGFAIQYVREQPAPPPAEYAGVICGTLRRGCERHGLPLPRLLIEPGRATVGRAGVALYRVGARKEVPGVRTFVSVDGGMADNIRPAIYGSRYEAVSADRPLAPAEETVTVAGRYCESGDVLIRDIPLPRLDPGELLAVPAAGAYCMAMSSNYNWAPRPAVVLVEDGRAQLVRRRETYDDLLRCEVD